MTDDASPHRGPVTLRDVAAAAGVSTSTASRVLDDRLPPSRSATAERVRQAADALGYQPDQAAASLRRGRTMTVGVVVPRLTDTVMAMLYEALAHECRRSGMFAIVATTDDEPQADRVAAKALLARKVDGLVMTTARDGDDFPSRLSDGPVPVVLALRGDGVTPSSVGDDELGGYLATRHLVDLGHERIAVVAGPSYASSARGRVAGYRSAMAEAALEVDPAWVVPSTFGMESGADAATALMRLVPRPTAVFAVNDNTAIGALSALRGLGLAVPDDVSLVGYNDIPVVSRLSTPLTTVRVPFDRIAAAAIDLLRTPPTDPRDRLRVAAPTLIPRRSSGPVRPST